MKHVVRCAAVLLMIIVSYASPSAGDKADGANISCEQALALIKAHEGDTNFVIIDFRPKEKYEKSHLENATYYDVFSDGVDGWLDSLDKNKTYLIYCTIGHRSGIALAKMRDKGFENVYHMNEGLRLWQARGYKTLGNKD